MDRYFYIIEQDENGNKVIHIQGNLYFCDGGYCHSEWTFLYFDIDKAKRMIANLYDKSDCELYGTLTVKNIKKEEVQAKIDEIKNGFSDDNTDWTVEDVLNEFPAEWEWEFNWHCEHDTLWI